LRIILSRVSLLGAGMCKSMRELELLLSYELGQSRRHLRYFSLVMLRLNEAGPKLASLLRGGMRESDSTFFSENAALVVMGETHKTDAIKAVNRYRDEYCDRFDTRSSVSSFPDDGVGPKELMSTLKHRLKTAMGLDRGSVVTE
jgi:hypothetical protein